MPKLNDNQLAAIINEAQQEPGATPEGVLDLLSQQGYTWDMEADSPAQAPSPWRSALNTGLDVARRAVTAGPLAPLAGLDPRAQAGFGAGLRRQSAPEGTGALGTVGEMAGRAGPALVAGAAAAPFTGGLSIPAALAAEAVAMGGGELASQGISAALGGNVPETRKEAAWEIFKAGAAPTAIRGVFKGGEVFFKAFRPQLVKLWAQLIRTISGVPEKYGAEVLNNPDILTKAPSVEAAGQIYRSAIKGTLGARDYLLKETGDLIMSPGDATKVANQAYSKLASQGALPLDEALAARQSVSFLLQAAKMGNPEQRANLSNLVKAKTAFDDYLESGLPGFKKATRTYFEANAREAFEHILPQNKNMSPNVLRALGGLASFSAAAFLRSPIILLSALPTSPRFAGFAILKGRGAARLVNSQLSQFAARVGALRAVQGDEDERK